MTPNVNRFLNRDTISNLTELDPSGTLITQLVNIYEHESERAILGIKYAIDVGNIKYINELAHRFRSTCYNLGARSSGKIASQIEQISSEKHEDFELIEILNNCLEKEVKMSLLIIKKTVLELMLKGEKRMIS